MLHAFGQTISLSIYSLVMASAAHKMGPSFRFEGQQGDPPGKLDGHSSPRDQHRMAVRCFYIVYLETQKRSTSFIL